MSSKKIGVGFIFGVVFLLFSFSDTSRFFEIAKSLETFASLFKEVNEYYVEEINPTELMETGIGAMLEELDPYTNFIPENRIEEYRTQNTGQYAGIGATIGNFEGTLKVTDIKKGYPADLNGLKIGDEIKSIDGFHVTDLDGDQFNELIKGQVNSQITLEISRYGNDTPIVIAFSREKVESTSVSFSGMITPEIGYVKLEEFTMHCGRDLKKEIKSLLSEGATNLILDLRGNPGGLLIESVNIVNLFVEKGEEVVTTKGKLESSTKTYYTLSTPLDTVIPLIVLINSGSASASEIVSGTLQDYDRAVILGNKSFGKGLVQVTRPLSFNSQLKVTTAKYYTPSGRCIQALDYSNRNPDGSVGKVPDSLKSVFKTKNGRSVFDGGGVDPDVEISDKKYPHMAVALSQAGYIFDFATQYYYANPNANFNPSEFTINGNLYDNFSEFISSKDYSYTTEVEEKIKKLTLISKNEKFYEILKNETDLIAKAINDRKEHDILVFEEDIKQLIAQQIVTHYHYSAGRIEYSLKFDPFIDEAVRLFRSPQKYNSILTK